MVSHCWRSRSHVELRRVRPEHGEQVLDPGALLRRLDDSLYLFLDFRAGRRSPRSSMMILNPLAEPRPEIGGAAWYSDTMGFRDFLREHFLHPVGDGEGVHPWITAFVVLVEGDEELAEVACRWR